MHGALLVVKGPKKGELLLLRKEVRQTIIGRDIKCDIHIDDPSISRRHFCIVEQEGKFFIQDMGSSNGTFVNGQRTLWQEIQVNAVISFSGVELRFLLLTPEELKSISASHPKSDRVSKVPASMTVTQPLSQVDVLDELNAPSTSEEPASEGDSTNYLLDTLLQKDRKSPIFSEYKDPQRLTKTLATLYKVLELVNSQLQLKQMLEVLLKTVLEITKAERGCILLKKSAGAPLETVAFCSRDPLSPENLPISHTIVNLAVAQGTTTVNSDAMSDQKFRKDEKASVVIHHIRSVICVPLEGRERILGAIYMDSQLTCNAFDQDDLELLRAIGRQAGLAVDRALLQEEISRSEQKYRTIFEKSPFGIALISPSGRIVDINPTGLSLGLRRGNANIPKSSILEIFPQIKPFFQKLLQDAEPFEMKELPVADPEGNYKIFRLTGVPLMNEAGAAEGGMLIAEDITAAKKLQSQLIQQDKMATVGLLAAGVAHEFNNIIAGMMGYAQLVIKKKLGETEELNTEGLANVVVSQCQRAKEVIDRLLNFSRRKDTPREPVKLDALLEDVFQLVRRELVKNNIEIVRKFDDVPTIMANSGQIQQIFLNMVLNAMQAMSTRSDGQLTVFLKSDKNFVTIIFEDNGVGIPAKNLPRIFEPFFTTKGNHGTGLGLSVSYTIIQECGGEITFESKENQGTKFIIRLPLGSQDETAKITLL